MATPTVSRDRPVSSPSRRPPGRGCASGAGASPTRRRRRRGPGRRPPWARARRGSRPACGRSRWWAARAGRWCERSCSTMAAVRALPAGSQQHGRAGPGRPARRRVVVAAGRGRLGVSGRSRQGVLLVGGLLGGASRAAGGSRASRMLDDLLDVVRPRRQHPEAAVAADLDQPRLREPEQRPRGPGCATPRAGRPAGRRNRSRPGTSSPAATPSRTDWATASAREGASGGQGRAQA